MTDVHEGAQLEPDASSLAREEAQRRIEEILQQRDDRSGGQRRTRKILVAVLILLLLLLLVAGVFLYRMISPSGSGAGSDESDADLAGITWIRSIYGYGPAESQHFKNPNDAVTAPDGTIWITDPGHAAIVNFRGDGTYVRRVVGNLQTGKPFRVPSRVAVDSAGILYLADRANETLTIMDGQKPLASANIPGLTSVEVNDEMVVVGSTSGFAILDKDGNVKTLIGTRGQADDQFDSVGGVAIDSAKKTIYVIDTYNNRLSAWDYTGKRKWMVTTGNPANKVKLEGADSLVTTSSAPAALQLPVDVTIDAKGRPLVLDSFGFRIAAFEAANGKYVNAWGTNGEKDGQFMYPTGLNYDSAKDWVVVADTANLRAEIVRIKGTGAGGASGLASGLARLLAGPARALWPCLILLPLLLLIALLASRRRRRDDASEAGEAVPAE